MKLNESLAQDRHRDVSPSTSRLAGTNFQLEGVWLHLARGAWITFVLAQLVIIILALFEARIYELSICPFASQSCAVSPATAQALHRLGIAPSSYVTYNLVLALFQSLVFLGVGGVIFWRKSSEPICLAASLVFVSLGLLPLFSNSTYPPAVVFGYISVVWWIPTFSYFLLAFPDGHFVPRWSWLLIVLWIAQAIAFVIPGPFNILSWPPPLFGAELLLTYGGTIGVQIYRYVRVSSNSQRQQTKWLVFGLAGFIALQILVAFIATLFPGLAAPDSTFQLLSGALFSFLILILPLSVGIAIQRSRLWDIDILIRRTFVYTTLTVILALIYAGLVFIFGTLLHNLFDQGQQNPVVIVASTLVIAALFQPLRHRIQRIIDRRFYRRRYDAAKTVAAFSTTMRQEVDLDQLREELVAVVTETMQPSHVSLWLPPAKPDRKQPTAWSSPPPAP